MKSITLYNTSSKGKIKVWTCSIKGNKITTVWGYEDGAKQETVDVVAEGKNIGKANETTPEEQAEFEWSRRIRLKKETGYNETLIVVNSDNINWDTGQLPDSFAPAKPATSITTEKEKELQKKGVTYYTRKYNGMRIFIVRGREGTRIFSRRIEDKTQHFPTFINEFNKLLPIGTMLDAEIIANDNPDLIKEIFGAKPDKAIERQQNQKVEIKIFDVLYIDFKQLKEPYAKRYEIFHSLIDNIYDNVSAVEKLNITRPTKNMEGLVLWDGSSVTNIRFDAKPDRRSGAYKIKNFTECDIICTGWQTGKGKNNFQPAVLNLAAYDKNGQLIEMGDVGSGLTDKDKYEIQNEWKFPCVIEVQYEEITPKNRFRLPVFLRKRDDKPLKEVTLEDILNK